LTRKSTRCYQAWAEVRTTTEQRQKGGGRWTRTIPNTIPNNLVPASTHLLPPEGAAAKGTTAGSAASEGRGLTTAGPELEDKQGYTEWPRCRAACRVMQTQRSKYGLRPCGKAWAHSLFLQLHSEVGELRDNGQQPQHHATAGLPVPSGFPLDVRGLTCGPVHTKPTKGSSGKMCFARWWTEHMGA
jgi:hypothetical protein